MAIQTGHVVVLGIIVAVIAFIGVAAVLLNQDDRVTQQAWRDFASRHGLVYQAKRDIDRQAQVSGELRGRAFRMWQQSDVTPSQEHTRHTLMSLQPRGMPDGLSFYARPDGRLGEAAVAAALRLGTITGSAAIPPEIVTGDSHFDAKYVTRGFDAEAALAWLAPHARRQVLAEVIADPDLELLKDGLVWEGTTPRSVDAIEAVARRLEDYAGRLEQVPSH